jgi:peptidyl-prolyl cis-trans isomerase D
VTTDYVAKDGVIGGLSDASSLLTQAFSAAKGSAPGTASTGDGYAMFQVLDVKPAHAPDFAEYKSHILDDYRNEKAPQLVQDQLRKLNDRAKVLNDLKKAAAEFKVPVKSSDLVGQDGQVPDLGSMAGSPSVAFSLPKGAISGPVSTADGGGVLSVTDKQEPSPEEIAKNFDQTREQLLNQQRNEMFNVFVGTLAKRYEDGKGIRMSKQAATVPGS